MIFSYSDSKTLKAHRNERNPENKVCLLIYLNYKIINVCDGQDGNLMGLLFKSNSYDGKRIAKKKVKNRSFSASIMTEREICESHVMT